MHSLLLMDLILGGLLLNSLSELYIATWETLLSSSWWPIVSVERVSMKGWIEFCIADPKMSCFAGTPIIPTLTRCKKQISWNLPKTSTLQTSQCAGLIIQSTVLETVYSVSYLLNPYLSAKLRDKRGKQDTAPAFRTIMIHSRGDQVKCGGGIWVLRPGQGPPAKWLPSDINKREHIKETQKGLCWERQLQETPRSFQNSPLSQEQSASHLQLLRKMTSHLQLLLNQDPPRPSIQDTFWVLPLDDLNSPDLSLCSTSF